MRDLTKLDDPEPVTRYLEDQRDLQRRLGGEFDQQQLRRNQQLLWAWDFLSLGLCLRWDGRSVNGLTLHADTIEPWPFGTGMVHLHTEGRRLTGRYASVGEMRTALDAAPWVTLDFELSRRP
jgi:hypothetical protein